MEWTEGDVVRKIRSACGLTLQDLAGLAGVSLTAVNRLETGHTKEAKRGTLNKIANVFGLSGPDLLGAIPHAIEVSLRTDVRDVIDKRLAQESISKQRSASMNMRVRRRRAGSPSPQRKQTA